MGVAPAGVNPTTEPDPIIGVSSHLLEVASGVASGAYPPVTSGVAVTDDMDPAPEAATGVSSHRFLLLGALEETSSSQRDFEELSLLFAVETDSLSVTTIDGSSFFGSKAGVVAGSFPADESSQRLLLRRAGLASEVSSTASGFKFPSSSRNSFLASWTNS
jgi:hypothetical protein